MKYLAIVALALLLFIPIAVSAEDIVLARGDSITITTGYQNANVWVFSNSGLDHIYDVPLSRFENNTGYVDFNSSQTEALDDGRYTVVIHSIGDNGIKEVSYLSKLNASLQKNEFLVSPFKTVKDVEINGLQPHDVMEKLIEMRDGTDDVLTFQNLTVEEPLTVINGLDQINDDKVFVFGISNLAVGTPIKILWDSDRLVSQQDYRLNTYMSSVYAWNNSTQRRWNATLNVSIQDLPPGKHWIDLISNEKVTRVAYNAAERWENQTPPPEQKIRYLNNGVVVTPTPEIKEVPVYVDREVTVIQTVVITTQPFPKNALGEEYNPYEVLDMSKYAFALAACLVGLIILKKGTE
jgi:hypothetical protein